MSLLDEAEPVRDGETLDACRLGEYLAAQVSGLVLPLVVRQFPSGFSNLTYLLTAGSREFVLRRPPQGTLPKSGHDMGREFRVLSALQGAFAESPRPLHLCADESVIGAPFYVVERIRGIILRRDYPAGLEPTPALVRVQQCALIDTLARLHGLDHHALGLDEFGRPEGYVARQVEGWSGRYQRVLTADAASADAVTKWLATNRPPDTKPAALIHNDYKLDNVVFDAAVPARLIGVLDWEMATVGDPWMDLGCSLAYWIEAGDPAELQETRMLPTHLPGSLTRSEVVQRYALARAVDAPEFRFYRVFGLFRLAVIVQQIYYRFFHGQTRDPRFAALGPMARVLIARAETETRA
ncbi:MAG TPA: phosphotransferase family protein [Steroidobacteraceae bacterium]|nr:phosphotransferase family protein [Steroidobacteraceae bacterium]